MSAVKYTRTTAPLGASHSSPSTTLRTTFQAPCSASASERGPAFPPPAPGAPGCPAPGFAGTACPGPAPTWASATAQAHATTSHRPAASLNLVRDMALNTPCVKAAALAGRTGAAAPPAATLVAALTVECNSPGGTAAEAVAPPTSEATRAP